MSTRPPEAVFVRHGETEWTRSGQHTGRTDIPLTDRGREEARALGTQLAGRPFALVLTSPLVRAAETCRLTGLAEQARERDDLMEWDYGVPEGETAAQVATRVDRIIAELQSVAGDAAVFAHGHVLRVLVARWL